METFLKIMLILHIISGFTALITGCIAMIVKKGSGLHKKSGKIFFYSMLGVSATALTISTIRWSFFLFTIGIFAFFQNYSGYRSIKNKSLKPTIADWLVVIIAVINSALMLTSMNIVLMVFGIISISLAISDINTFVKTTRNKEISKKQWLARHIGMMVGTYIATLTAFLVVNIKHVGPYWVPWLLPTFILTPLIVYWTRKYAAKPKTTAV